MASTSTSSSSSSPFRHKWDVFLSFYDKDTGRNFISHLYSALDQAGVKTFRDDHALEKGQEISSGLISTIKHSQIIVVVISENYARSPWCLGELVEIIDCMKTGEYVVIPVFYCVDPSDLLRQKGSFSEALIFHQKRYSNDIIQKWKSALAEIAQLAGHSLKKDANDRTIESDTIQNIVRMVSQLAYNRSVYLDPYLVGIDSVVEEIYQKLGM